MSSVPSTPENGAYYGSDNRQDSSMLNADYDDDTRSITSAKKIKQQISKIFTKKRKPALVDTSYMNDDNSISNTPSSYRPPTSDGSISSRRSVNGGGIVKPPNVTNIFKKIAGKKPALQRYRGFSTSISNLFLDESVVCPSAACCGVLSSSRTEHLLHTRNQRRKMTSSEFRSPSRILGISLLLMIVGFATTYIVWGFGDVQHDDDYYLYYDGYDGAGNRRMNVLTLKNAINANSLQAGAAEVKKMYIPNVMRFKDYHDLFWKPVEIMVQDIWYQQENQDGSIKIKDNFEQLNLNNGRRTNLMEQENHAAIIATLDDILDDSMNSNGNDRKLLKKSIWKNQEIAENIRGGLCILFFLILGIFGRRRRLKTRFAVLKARAQDDKVYYGNSNNRIFRGSNSTETKNSSKRKEKYEGACSHTLCGCVAMDNADDELNDGQSDKIEADQKIGVQNNETSDNSLDCMNRGFKTFSSLFCGSLCKMWIQCFSICALAQEARESRLLLPPRDQRVDYITHQPFAVYFKNIYTLRTNWKNYKGSGWSAHFGALSTLSRYILSTFIISTVLIILTEKYNPQSIFTWADAAVMLMTFLQSFAVLGIVHGLFHKSDLSLDAVIKFFAAGFVIATPMAFFFEAFVMNIFIIFFYIFAGVDALAAKGAAGSWISNHYTPFLITADVIQAFLVAAAVEELCKYYSFRAVEHPDLLFLTGLDRLKQDKKAMIGGDQAYPYSLNNASSVDCRGQSFDRSFSFNKSDRKRHHRGNNSPAGTPRRNRKPRFGDDDQNDEPDIRTPRQQAAAVTTAMISVAVGLACAENFIYVFFLGGNNTQEEIIMLIFRSIFPVHALCAGMQSIGINKKFLEEGETGARVGVGKIVLPAILLHGAFDSALMVINSWIDNVAANGNGPDLVQLNIAAAGTITAIMLIGTLTYYIHNRRQKARLKLIEVSRTLPVAVNDIYFSGADDNLDGKALDLL